MKARRLDRLMWHPEDKSGRAYRLGDWPRSTRPRLRGYGWRQLSDAEEATWRLTGKVPKP